MKIQIRDKKLIEKLERFKEIEGVKTNTKALKLLLEQSDDYRQLYEENRFLIWRLDFNETQLKIAGIKKSLKK